MVGREVGGGAWAVLPARWIPGLALAPPWSLRVRHTDVEVLARFPICLSTTFLRDYDGRGSRVSSILLLIIMVPGTTWSILSLLLLL